MATRNFLAVFGALALMAGGFSANVPAGQPSRSAPEAKAAPDDVANEVTQGALRFKNPEGTYVECPLKHTDVSANISGFIARVRVTQTFVNSAKDKIEAVYVFPLPHGAAVDGMTMVVGDKRVVGLIKRRSVARQIY